MAPRARRRRARGCRPPSGTLKGEDAVKEHLTVSAQSARCDGSPMTVRGGGVPAKTTALMPLCRMGPPPRSFRCDAHHCIMVWVLTHRIQGCGTNVRAHTRAPPRTSSSRPKQVCRRARTRQGRSPCGCGATRLILDRFCARRLYAIVGSGRRNGLGQVEQRNSEARENG